MQILWAVSYALNKEKNLNMEKMAKEVQTLTLTTLKSEPSYPQ